MRNFIILFISVSTSFASDYPDFVDFISEGLAQSPTEYKTIISDLTAIEKSCERAQELKAFRPSSIEVMSIHDSKLREKHIKNIENAIFSKTLATKNNVTRIVAVDDCLDSVFGADLGELLLYQASQFFRDINSHLKLRQYKKCSQIVSRLKESL